MIAEWERHNVVLMAFPHQGTDWAVYDDWERVTAPFVRIAQAIAYYQMVYMLCRQCESIKALFCSTTNIIFIEADYNDTWTRDYGPISLTQDNHVRLLDFRFDGWGGRYEAALDNHVNRFLSSKGFLGGVLLEEVDYTLEGGSIDTDGQGTIMTTSRCLCHPNRNGGASKHIVEKVLSDKLNAQRVLWLDHGYLAGDDTDGHIDTLAKFVNPETIVYVKCDDPADEHYEELSLMEEELMKFTQADGTPYRLVPLPLPEPKYSIDKERLPATYINFLISNGAVVYPTYNDKTNDKKVGNTLRELFPDREVIPINCLSLIEQGGSLHCSTMQIAY